jgi:hypothetical protein
LVNWDWMMKLKTNKTFTKEPIPKIKNQNNKNWSWNVNNQEGQTTIFGGREGKIFLLSPNQTTNGDTLHQQEEYMVMLPTT